MLFTLRRALIALIMLAAGCARAAEPKPPPPTAASEFVPVGGRDEVPPPALWNAAADDTQMLAWIDRASGQSGGRVSLIGLDGEITPLLDVPAGASVVPCGAGISPDSRFFAFFVGGSTGAFMLMDGALPPVTIDDSLELLACRAGEALAFSPDGARFAYIDYHPDPTLGIYAEGTLRIFDAASTGEVAAFSGVTAFQLADDRAVFVRFYANDRGRADEASVFVWDGVEAREIVTITPIGTQSQTDCWFTSAAIAQRDPAALMVVGRRCQRGDSSTHWQVYTVDLEERSAALHVENRSPGAFVPFAGTNEVFFAPDGSIAYFTVPDGVTAGTAALMSLHLPDLAIEQVVERQAVFPQYDAGTMGAPVFSPDGSWLALPVTSPNGDQNRLMALELAQPSAPVIIELGGDRTGGMVFSPDSTRLYYHSGSGGQDDALFALDLALGTPSRIARVPASTLAAITPDDGLLALAARQRGGTTRAYDDLLALDAQTGTIATLYTGADIVDGQVTNPRFAVPLAWRVSQNDG